MPVRNAAAVSAFCSALIVFPIESAKSEQLALSTSEARTTISLKAKDEAVKNLLPPGWTVVPGSGPQSGANLTVVFIEGFGQSDASGKPAALPDKYAVVGTTAKNEATGKTAFFVCKGLVSPATKAPGAYSVFAPAKASMTKLSRSSDTGTTVVEERWDFTTEAGDTIHFATSYERGIGTRTHVEPTIYSAAKPDFFRIYKVDQLAQTVYSATSSDKKPSDLEFSTSGSMFSNLLNGSEEVVAVTTIPSYYRQIYLPD